jgi:hypothetical protein
MVQVTAVLGTLEFQESAKCKGHFALYNYLVLGHTKYIESNGFTALHFQAKFQPNSFTAVITWT